MPAAAKKKAQSNTSKQTNAPTLAQRIEMLRVEADAELDQLAEEHRPKGEHAALPAPWLRQHWLAQAKREGADDVFGGYLAALKETN